MTEYEKDLVIRAIDSYIDSICAGEVIGTDDDIDILTDFIEKIKNI